MSVSEFLSIYPRITVSISMSTACLYRRVTCNECIRMLRSVSGVTVCMSLSTVYTRALLSVIPSYCLYPYINCLFPPRNRLYLAYQLS